MAEQSLKDKTAKGLFWGGVSNGVQQLLRIACEPFVQRPDFAVEGGQMDG